MQGVDSVMTLTDAVVSCECLNSVVHLFIYLFVGRYNQMNLFIKRFPKSKGRSSKTMSSLGKFSL